MKNVCLEKFFPGSMAMKETKGVSALIETEIKILGIDRNSIEERLGPSVQ